MTAEFKIEHSMIENPILAESYSMGASGGKKAAETSDVVFVKAMDKNTPGLMKALVDSAAIPKVELDLSKTETSEAGEETKTAVLGYVFENARVTGVQHAGSKESASETVSLSFEKMEIKSPEGKEMEHDTKGAESK
jgi:type VI protein secretion system component Hcp